MLLKKTLILTTAMRLVFQVPRMKAKAGSSDGAKRRSAQERLHAAENKIVVIGLSHKTASVDVREKLAVQEQHWQAVQNEIAGLPSIKEAALLSTCNRHEIYVVTPNSHKGIQEVTQYLSEANNVSKLELRQSLFMLTEDDAVWHCLRVAGGLDSLVIGEGQILSQMKKCHDLSSDKGGAAGKVSYLRQVNQGCVRAAITPSHLCISSSLPLLLMYTLTCMPMWVFPHGHVQVSRC